MNITNQQSDLMPILPTLGAVAFPRSIVSIDISRSINIDSINAAMVNKQNIFVVLQKDLKISCPLRKELHTIGTVVEIKNFEMRSKDVYNLTGIGQYRAKLVSYDTNLDYCRGVVKRIPEKRIATTTNDDVGAMMRVVKKTYMKYAITSKLNNHEITFLIEKENNPVLLFYVLSTFIPFEAEVKQLLLEENEIKNRLMLLNEQINKQIIYIEMENRIARQIEDKIDQNQRDYFIRERAKLISREANDIKLEADQEDEYINKINNIKNMDEQSKEKLKEEVEKMNAMPEMSHESYVISNYLDTVLKLPWDTKTEDKMDLKKSKVQLDLDHYGLEKVKERIIENLAVRVFKKDLKSQIICLVGPPGVGKTSLGKSIAKTMGRKFVRISLGGINDESEIRGHRKTYIGAMPGRIISGIMQSRSRNPVVLLDEIDKMTSNLRGDPASAMLEVLDPEQNSLFVDHYIEIPFDLSDCLFITTANTISTIPAPLYDRMEVIELSSYTANEKFHIAKEYLLNKQLKENGLNKRQIKINDNALKLIINGYTREAGVRGLERKIASLIRKGAKKLALEDKKSITFNKKNLEEYLGPLKYLEELISKKDEIGLVNGLAWTSVGGELMQIEASEMEGKGELKLTGNLGDVMKESAIASMSYVRSVAKKYGIKSDFFKTTDIHIHLPEGAVPKDGPSAGVTVTTAIISVLTKRAVKRNVAMTGEITLRGRVLPIGGLKEKSIAAYKSGIKTVYIPKENMRDLVDIDEEVVNAIEFIPVEYVSEIIDRVLVKVDEKVLKNSIKYKKTEESKSTSTTITI